MGRIAAGGPACCGRRSGGRRIAAEDRPPHGPRPLHWMGRRDQPPVLSMVIYTETRSAIRRSRWMKAWKALGDLTCGKPVAGELGAALTVIRPNVVQAVSGLCHHRRSRNRDHKILCALYGRSLLDLTCAAIIGRMDPFRLEPIHKPTDTNMCPVDGGRRSKDKQEAGI